MKDAPNSNSKDGFTYQDAGVDISKANILVNDIRRIATRTHRPGVMTGIGGFGALFELPIDRYQKPVLVSGTDGVGTKLKLAMTLKKHDTIGIDLVAMCANDIVTQGAEPLFFLDYFATGKLLTDQTQTIIEGIATGCELAGTALIGGETAEMPGMYHGEDYDLAGFCVGIVEKENIIDGKKVQDGDALIGIASSGLHSNGFSLARRVIDHSGISLDSAFSENSLGGTLLTPTRIYIKSILALIQAIDVHAIAHITGGGLIDNIPRVLPPNTQAIIDSNSWKWPKIFRWLKKKGHIENIEMLRTFNVGVGMVVCVTNDNADKTIELLNNMGEDAWKIGHVEYTKDEKPSIIIE